VRTSERHQLKQDRFAQTTKDLITGAVEHRTVLVRSVAIAAFVAILAGGLWWYGNYRGEQANTELGRAMRTYDAPLRPPNTPATPDTPSFQSASERTQAAQREFQQVADRYSHTDAGKLARYMAGLTAIDAGDNATAEKNLKAVVDSGNSDLASLAKLALANFYRSSNRIPEAKRLYEELISAPTNVVSKPMAQLQLADLFAGNGQTAEANKLYEEIVKENAPVPGPPGKMPANAGSPTAASIAQQRLSGK
jgi:TolA-binding protein